MWFVDFGGGVEVGVVVMLRELGGDLVRTASDNEQDRALECCEARQKQAEEDEGVRVEAGSSVEPHPE
ncbi:MAG: hypothetical protein ACJAR2_001369 [Ilumatobacter sp.]